jgi:2-phospho-L-lactate/phosphoenolpyruvate guanylyltransferase
MRTLAILPVKSFPRAKQRLRPGLDGAMRRQLAEAMLGDVLDALAASAVDEVVVVTAGATVRRIAEQAGAQVLEEREEGHNVAATRGIEWALQVGADRALLVPGDCPALDPAELDALLARALVSPSALIVPDRHGTGTNALLLSPPDALRPSFGPGSAQRHAALARAGGIDHEVVEVPSLALDIDTPADVAALASLSERGLRAQDLLSRC